MGLRLFLTLIAIWVIYLVIRRYFSQQAKKREIDSRSAVDMVRCLHCGTHLPKQEALIKRGEYYCCKEHMKAGQGNT